MPQEESNSALLASDDYLRVLVSAQLRLFYDTGLADSFSLMPLQIPSEVPLSDSFLVHAFVSLESILRSHVLHDVFELPLPIFI
jgi:hypothetical protein